MFGVDCPGCGMQRAFIALLRGDLVTSLKYNASLIPFLITIFYTIGHLIFSFRNGAKYIVILFSVTVSVLVVNFVIKLILLS